MGQHPLVTRVLKGAFNSKPPKPRYSSTWKVSQVVTWLNQQDNKHILQLTLTMMTLCALCRPCRSAELASFSFPSLVFSPEGASASPLHYLNSATMGGQLSNTSSPSLQKTAISAQLPHYSSIATRQNSGDTRKSQRRGQCSS